MAGGERKRREILATVLDILKREGVGGLSTAVLAAEAHCSKATLYTLFGNRAGILRALISEQSQSVNDMLRRSEGGDPQQALVQAGAALLDLLTGEASLAINRAAMLDATGELGQLLLEQGRGRSAPLFAELFARLQAAGTIGRGDAQAIFLAYYGLLMGDRQIRMLLGDRSARPVGKTFIAISKEAMAQLVLLYPPAS